MSSYSYTGKVTTAADLANGIARSGGEAENPQLWDGLLHLWVPFVHPRLDRVYDWGPYRHHLDISGDVQLKSLGQDSAIPAALRGGHALRFNETGVDGFALSPAVIADDEATNWGAVGGTGSQTVSQITLIVWAMSRTDSAASGHPVLFNRVRNGGNDWGIGIHQRAGRDEPQARLATDLGRTQVSFPDSSEFDDGRWHQMVVKWGADSGVIRTYFDGVLTSGTAARTGATIVSNTVGNTHKYSIGGHGVAPDDRQFVGDIGSVGIWAREMTAVEIWENWVNPLALMEPVRSIIVIAPTGAAAALAGTITDNDTVSGGVLLSSKITATATDDDTASADVLLSSKMTATAADDDTASADLARAFALAATATDDDTASADVLLASKITATATDDDTASADLARAFSLTATATDDDTASADLTIVGADIALAGTITDDDTASADVLLASKMTATATDDDTASADLTIAGAVLEGTVADDDIVSGNVLLASKITGTATDDDTASADLARAFSLTATATDDDTASAGVLLASKITGTATDDDTASAIVLLLSKITATVADNDTASADLVITGGAVALAGTIRDSDTLVRIVSLSSGSHKTRASTFTS